MLFNILLEYSEAVAWGCSIRKVFLKIWQISQEKACVPVFFLIKLQALGTTLLKKENQVQVFSCEFCEIFKNTFFYRIPPVAASEY